MNRRDFLAASSLAALSLASAPLAGAAETAPPSPRQLMELRIYSFASPDKQAAFDAFLAKAFIPALGRAGVGPVGVFKLLKNDNPDLKTLPADSTDLYLLLPHNSPESLLTLTAKLDADDEFQKIGQPTLITPKSDPAYLRYESSLMLAFPNVPAVQRPSTADSRIFQLRIYESHNAERARLKIHMFNEGGEVDIFRRCNMNPVFFGQSLVGSKLPNLTYMLAFDDDSARKAAWAAFLKDPAWEKISSDEKYKDTVSHITNLFLRPANSSQI